MTSLEKYELLRFNYNFTFQQQRYNAVTIFKQIFLKLAPDLFDLKVTSTTKLFFCHKVALDV